MAGSLGLGYAEAFGKSAALQTDPLEDDGHKDGGEKLCIRVLFDLSKPYPRDIGTGGILTLNSNRETIPLGRDTRCGNGVALMEDRSVSRRHVEVRANADGRSLQLCTLDAKNSTYVNGMLVQGDCTLDQGSVLRIGGTILLVGSTPAGPSWSGARMIAGMRGDSPALQKVRWMVSRRADSSMPVVIWGESGVGKELVAEALHQQSRRREKPFVKVNCATLNPSLAASELFGHQKGAFTGATQTTRGLFGEAAGGTLLLDEIHWLTPDVQGQLLRALDSGKVRPTGGTEEEDYGVRVVAASNRDLRALSDSSTLPFLADLRARLGDWYRIHIPPLRERREDILPIFVGLLEKEASQRERRWLLNLKLSWRMADVLITRPWLNNVRDLRTVAQALVDLTPEDADCLSLDPIEEFLPSPSPTQDRSSGVSTSAEVPMKPRRIKGQRLSMEDEAEVRRSLLRNRGNVKAAELETGVNERTIRRLAERWRAKTKDDEGSGGR